VQALVITRGAAGATAHLPVLSVPALPIVPIDTTGAGDTLLGLLGAALDIVAALETGLRRAGAAAGLACLARGAQSAVPNRAPIDAAVLRLPAA
jgi:ribokinase